MRREERNEHTNAPATARRNLVAALILEAASWNSGAGHRCAGRARAILSALEEPADETAASPTDMPSLATSATPTATTATLSVEPVAVPRVVGTRLENAKDLLKETDCR